MSLEEPGAHNATDGHVDVNGLNTECDNTEGKDKNETVSQTESSTPSTSVQSKSVSVNDNTVPADSEWSSAFDPLPLSGIAKIFPLDKDEQRSHDLWRNHAGMASRNGLKHARVSVGKGNAESTFDPWLAAEWLIDKGHYARDKAERKLAHNLPQRSAHLRDLILL